MNEAEYRTQMTLWCILAAPLFAGNDLTKMDQNTLELLANPEAIAVNQDAKGVQGRCALPEGPVQTWTKPLADGGTAVALLNLDAHPITMTVDFKVAGLPEILEVRDLWLHRNLGVFKSSFTFPVPRHGAVFLKVKPAQ
jgi:alpha-galactosidase